MKVVRLITVVTLVFTVPVAADGIYRWTDESGQVHYSDRSPPPQADAKELELPETRRGWEEMLDEGDTGSGELLSATEKAINSLEAQRIRTARRHRDTERSHEEAKAELAEAKMRRVEAYDPGHVADLVTQEERERRRLQELSRELAEIDAKLERLKALKQYGEEQAPKKAKEPAWQ